MENQVLVCRGLSKRYSKQGPPALDAVDLALPKGQIIGLLGPNGSGKTTLIKIASGLLTPSEGEILVAGQAVGIASKKKVSYLPEKETLPVWMKVADLLRFFADFYDDFDSARANDMLARLGIQPATRLKTMSKGTREKVQLVLAMSRDAELYLLDEPIGGVDPAARDFILETIIQNYRAEATVLLSTHLIADIEKVLDSVVFLKDGCVERVSSVDAIRSEEGKSVDALFREVYRC